MSEQQNSPLAKQGIEMAKKCVADGVDFGKGLVEKLSSPSTAQKKIIDAARKDYKENIDKDESAQIRYHLACIESNVFQSYLPQIKNLYEPLKVQQENPDDKGNNWKPDIHPTQVQGFDITKWVIDPNEDSIEKLCNVYQVLAGEECSVALIYRRDEECCHVQLVTCNNKEGAEQPQDGESPAKRLKAALQGNFPGVVCSKELIKNPIEAFQGSVAVLSNLATEKSEHFISQSMEKLLDGLVPGKNDIAPYAIILLATPVRNQADRRQELYNEYTAISPFAQVQKNISFTDSLSVMSNANVGLNLGVSGGIPNVVQFSGGVQIGYSAGTTLGVTGTEGQTLTYTNYEVKHCMERIEQQLNRMEQCQAMGMWDFAAYIVSSDYETVLNVSHMYVSLTQGEQSYLEPSAINIWKGGDSTDEENVVATYICESLKLLQHPPFRLIPENNDKPLPPCVYATTMVSGLELAHAMNFPRKSVRGLPVYECVSFGREVVLHSTEKSTDGKKNDRAPETITLGNIYHMRAEDENAPVNLQKDSLTAHTFITGSTGAGKSNAVYTMLNELCPEQKVDAKPHFLVIEPAKGEYKDVFGNRKDVSVYGTNFEKTPLLKMNPFTFPDNIHVLEHIDRLTEVFNACWPMYAAMPAVLKASIELSYTNYGWNLQTSKYLGGVESKKYPTFRDVMNSLTEVVDSKGFSKDTQGDYKGALLTRLESLTNGINGLVLCSANAIPDADLFDKNVIIDLSRVGSTETKSLLMGILVLKLQEYRMDERENQLHKDDEPTTDKGLQHITVLEEAHNLLRRTGTEQSQESANLQGKSVEMLTNAIAEMRTYGEGFIIADQAPGLLDMAVIRNTNTKIILRLPDESDRNLVGKAAGLNDDQIKELSRLDTGVAAVYQNHWLEPVLCKVTKFSKEQKKAYDYKNTDENLSKAPANDAFFTWLLNQGKFNLSDLDKRHTQQWIEQTNVDTNTKIYMQQTLKAGVCPNEKNVQRFLYCAAKGKSLFTAARTKSDPDKYMNTMLQQELQINGQLAKMIHEQMRAYIRSLTSSHSDTQNVEQRKELM